MDKTHARESSGESEKVFFQGVKIDKMENDTTNTGTPPLQNQMRPALPKTTSKSTFGRLGSNFRSASRNVAKGLNQRRGPQSGALRGLNSVRFIDKKHIGKEGDGWNAVETRFHQMAVDGKLSRDKFGICVGKYYSYHLFYFSVLFGCFYCWL